jgi:predicted phage terminase large subunit-like protein
MLKLAKAHKPLYWWAENGHISKSIGPFLQDRMMDEKVFFNIVPVTPVNDKLQRAQTFQGMMSTGLVMWPKTQWFQRAQKEFLMFPNGKHDDFVDAAAWLGMGVHRMIGSTKKKVEVTYEVPTGFNITPRLLHKQWRDDARLKQLALADR